MRFGALFPIILGLVFLCLAVACSGDDDDDDDDTGLPGDDDDDDNDDNDDDNDDNDDDDNNNDNDDNDDDDFSPPPSVPILNVLAEDAVTYMGPPVVFNSSCGDLWPTAWADDGNLYAANGDGFGFGWVWADMKVSRLWGEPPDMEGEQIEQAWGQHLGRLWPPQGWKVSHKPTGITCVDGRLYLFYQNLKNFLSDNEFGDAPAASISWSDDYGRTWDWDDTAPMFHDHVFTTGMFLDYGRCNQYAMDEYVYVYGLDYNWRYSEGYRSTKMYLARVLADRIPERDQWEFFTGLDGGQPTWSYDIEQKAPVLQDETEYAGLTGVSQGSIVYIPALNRYLYSTWSDSAWIFHEAEFPWGPWTRCGIKPWHEQPGSEDWMGGYATVIPSRYLDADGRGGWLVSSLLDLYENRYYRYGMRRFEIEIE
ncbi:MAG: DUF4185 domain-containing protein [Candidatus Lernaella stagnicola]|nr:DUF4185 domain-containing protein [Candidatus Lernaella stagnicola]